ncbi:hypothetical protein [Desulfolutivibrio sp.]|uniref:hypothetical protein n=1 Tax=Desulfolutivibrio sp. TaxID=2773296 RepID=UPI002F96DEA5
MTTSTLSLPDVLALLALYVATALVFLLTGRRFGREHAGRAMFERPLSEAPHEAADADQTDPWDAAMHGHPVLHPASADAREGGMAFFASRGRPAQAGEREGHPRMDNLYTT